ncbi:pro-thyrotropin-releasing hormone [Dunckerocampus dactyliophorus]|uniref:pro-thyrotropin-releasing hormone n=1 Tax=Dunckerocampus dactyliophorus TaxID=161453 RepID=UPI002405970C|nr:pro-thyrotropin-releasing hormone [Dunckerocampus dactyliophorus]
MKMTCLFVLASVLVCNLKMVCKGQSISAEEEPDQRTVDDLLHHSAESLLLRSILRKMQGEDDRNEGLSSQPEWVTKRQHPGKRYSDDLEKEDDGDEGYLIVEKRQHPGKRDEHMHSLVELQKRQHPGRRSTTGHLSDSPVIVVGELSKRQHPGKRYLVVRSRRQHPGKRQEEEGEEEEYLPEFDKRQHPGKRFWGHSDPDLVTVSPCEDVLDPMRCAKTNLLLDFLDNVSVKHTEEKRQHPGKSVMDLSWHPLRFL